MKNMNLHKRLIVLALAGTTALTAVPIAAQMMGGNGGGMMGDGAAVPKQGSAPRSRTGDDGKYGTSPGAMGGYGPGYGKGSTGGMMGGNGQGYGTGSGMMSGYGPRDGASTDEGPNSTDQQRSNNARRQDFNRTR